MYRTLQRCRAVRLAVSLSLGLSPLWIARCGSATLPEPPNPYEVLSSYTPRLEVALKRCAAALQKRSFGDVIVAVVPTPDAPPKFELDVSRSLGEEIVPCLRARFQPILATMLAHNGHASYDLYATVEVGPRRALPRVDASFMRLWLEGGGAGSAAAARLKARLPSEAALQSDMCLRLRGTDAFNDMVSRWLHRDAERVDDGWTDILARHFTIPREEFLAAWVVRPRTILLWTHEVTDPHADVPTRLCLARLNDAAVARVAGHPPDAATLMAGDDPLLP